MARQNLTCVGKAELGTKQYIVRYESVVNSLYMRHHYNVVKIVHLKFFEKFCVKIVYLKFFEKFCVNSHFYYTNPVLLTILRVITND